MSVSTLTPAADSSAAPRGTLRRALAATGAAAGCLLAAQGGWMLGLGLALACGSAGALAAPARAARDDRAAAECSGAALMAQQVVPVWERQLQSARQSAEDGLAGAMQGLAGITEGLAVVEQQATQLNLSATAGAADEVLGANAAALEALLAPMRRAFGQRDQALGLLGELREPMALLTQLSQQLQAVSAHTRLLSINASIEASRVADDGGLRAVAEEVRAVAARIGDTGEHIGRHLGELEQAIQRTQHQGELQNTSAEELRIELQLRAREALSLMLGSLSENVNTSQALRAGCEALRTEAERMLVSFQFGDRLNQMLCILGQDMERFVAWLAENRDASNADAAQWLATLEASYTMEEQRARHHDNVLVQRSAGVEFF
ncbi:methyl-accepting chemotaxis protein [Azohydromonas aeria]|uniref:methyl-accepting chemotaxis protein n=1 Tax=Azohydromonas aeria TaxID=2590212 RepID=UPI0012F71F9E|nr:methyl-accepting chemotaxis protein [Azohydromonas aeria]